MNRDISPLAEACEPLSPADPAPSVARATDLPLVHPAYLRLLLAAAKAEGIDLTARLSGLGLDAQALQEREEPVPLVAWRHILRDLQGPSRYAGLAVRIGYKVPMLAHGPLAYLMAGARDLHQALEALVRFAPLRLAVLEFRLREHARGVDLCAVPRVALGDCERFTLDFLWAMLCRTLEDLCRGATRVVTLHLPGPRAAVAAEWAELGVEVGRSTHAAFLQFPRKLADTVLPTASASEYQRAWRACEEAEREQGWAKSLSAQVEQLFRTDSADSYHLAWVASRLGMSRRTVMRKLDAEGTRFSTLVEASRRQRLLRRLAERQLTLGEIAVDLGYADGSAFHRAVRRWFGVGPQALQRSIAGGVPQHGLSPKDKSLAPKD